VDVPHITYLQQEVFGAIEQKVSDEKVIDSKVENRIKEIK
jgi:hypothetical protein